MKKVVKINFMLVLAAMFTFGFMSFKLISGADEEQQWHEILSPGATENDALVGGPIAAPDAEEDDCQAFSNDVRCAIQLTYDPEEYDPSNKTVATIMAEDEATLDQLAYRPEEN